MSRIKYLVIHCTDTPAKREVLKSDIERWHIKERGWSRVGYSDMIHLNGELENLIDYNQDTAIDSWEISNGARGYNGISRHVVYVGGSNGVDTRTSLQKITLEIYVKFMILRHPFIKVVGHNELSAKKCPSFNVSNWLKSIGVSSYNIGL
jgi:hypothetical protein